MKNIAKALSICAALLVPTVSHAQMVDAAQIRPILDMTKGQWVAVREYNGQDLIYFTHLLAWRCGLDKIQYGINSTKADQNWTFVPCDADAAAPSALDPEQKVYTGFELNSIQSVTVLITYDDGKTDTVTYQREAIKIQ